MPANNELTSLETAIFEHLRSFPANLGQLHRRFCYFGGSEADQALSNLIQRSYVCADQTGKIYSAIAPKEH